MLKRVIFLLLFVLAFQSQALRLEADEVKAEDFSDVYVAAPLEGRMMTAAYFRYQQKEPFTAYLTGVDIDKADRTELHETIMNNNVASMREITSPLSLKAGIEFRPGGHHIMVFAPFNNLIAGQEAVISFHIQDEGGDSYKVDVKARVAPRKEIFEHYPR